MLSFDEVPEFQKDAKRLKKVWRSIPKDIDNAKRVIERLYVPIDGVDIKEFRDNFFGTCRATILTSTEDYEVIKMRLDCASLGSDKKTRLTAVVLIKENQVKLIELYAKNSKEREDSLRIKRYIS